MLAVTLKQHGGTDNFKVEKVPDPKPKKNEVIVKHLTVGVNFFDYAYQIGQYKLPKFPAILGIEGCGIIEELGPEVIDYKVGDRIAYVNCGIGSYAEKRAVNIQNIVLVPDYITNEQVAGSFFKGLIAHSLLHRVYIASLAKKILIHSVAGGVGHILCQWAKFLNLDIVGTVGSDEKIDYARSIGCNYVINYRTQDLVAEVAKYTDFGGVGVVYDSVGKDTISKSLECLWSMGICISYGESSGVYNQINPNDLIDNCLYFTKPNLIKYKSIRSELVLSANELFEALNKGIVRPKITSYKFDEVAKAHNEIANRKNVGSIILKF